MHGDDASIAVCACIGLLACMISLTNIVCCIGLVFSLRLSGGKFSVTVVLAPLVRVPAGWLVLGRFRPP